MLPVGEINVDSLSRGAADGNTVDTSGVKPALGPTRTLSHSAVLKTWGRKGIVNCVVVFITIVDNFDIYSTQKVGRCNFLA